MATSARLASVVWLGLFTLLLTTSAAAQFDVKKKLRAATGQKPAPAAATTGATATAEVLVLDDQVIDRLIKGLRAAKANREAAAKGDTPYGRYLKASAGYADAKLKCDAGAQTLSSRMAADPKLGERNGVYLERMMAAQQKGDTAAQRAWGDSMAAVQDPACTVKQPQQPKDWYDQQRKVDTDAEEAELKASGFDRRESGQAKDRAIAIIQDAPPPDVSPSERQAVEKQEAQLKELMNLNPPPAARSPQPVPAAAVAPVQPRPTATPGQQATMDCISRNSEKHQKEIERLSEKANAAGAAGNTAELMAISDTLQRLQMGGCTQ